MRKKSALRKVKNGSIKIPIKKMPRKEAAVLRAILILKSKPSRKAESRPERSHSSAKRFIFRFPRLRFSPPLFLFKSAAWLLVFALNWFGLFAIGQTLAYYNDAETSAENAFKAGSLDFAIVPTSHMKSIGLAEEISTNSVLVNSGTLDWQYTLEAEKIAGNDDFCNALELEAKLNGVEKYDGSLLLLDVSSLTTLGTWRFNIEFPVDSVGVAHGDTCEVDFVYKGWQEEIPLYEDSGFTDEERISVTLTARMIVLNEFLPNPGGEAYGFDFGNDSDDMPQGEWVEIYNNSDSSYDLAGWYIWDASGAEANKISITAANTDLASTAIPAGGWLVIYMNKAVLNNGGDTVKLYDDGDGLVDSHAYISNDFCEIEPTPGDDNSTTASGECGGVPPNKSYARIPDGIGDWVDPIPTPGGRNILNEELNIASAASATGSGGSAAINEDPPEIVDDIVEDVPKEITDDVVAGNKEEDAASAPEETSDETADDVSESAAEENAGVEEAIVDEGAAADETTDDAVEEEIIIPDDSAEGSSDNGDAGILKENETGESATSHEDGDGGDSGPEQEPEPTPEPEPEFELEPAPEDSGT